MGSLNTVGQSFFSMIATGDFSNLIDNLEKAAKAGGDYAEALDFISKRKAGLSLEKAYNTPEQKERESVFRDKLKGSGDRMTAVTGYRDTANDEAKKALDIANAQVIAEEDKLKGLNVEPEKIKKLFLSYSTGYLTIEKAEKDIQTLKDIGLKQDAAGQSGNEKAFDKYKKEYEDFYNSLDEGEKTYMDLIKNNGKVSEVNLNLYLKAVEDAKIAEGAKFDVVISTNKVYAQITKEIQAQNEELRLQAIFANKAKNAVGSVGKDILLPDGKDGRGKYFENLTMPILGKKTTLSNGLAPMTDASEIKKQSQRT